MVAIRVVQRELGVQQVVVDPVGLAQGVVLQVGGEGLAGGFTALGIVEEYKLVQSQQAGVYLGQVGKRGSFK